MAGICQIEVTGCVPELLRTLYQTIINVTIQSVRLEVAPGGPLAVKPAYAG